MKKFLIDDGGLLLLGTIAIIIFFVCALQAQEPLTLPIVPPEEFVPTVKPEVSTVSPLVLPEVPSGQGMASLMRPEVPSFSPLALPQAESQTFEIGTHQFGGLNLFVPENRVPKEQMIQCRNLIPEGFSALKKRDGYEKVNFTTIDGVYGGTIAQGTIPQILVSCADSLRYADSTTSWEFDAIDTTEATLTYFASTSFGVVIMNGEDSTRIWDGSSIEALGIVDTGTFTSDTVDTEKAWTADEWIGYWAKCGTECVTLFEILDNGANWLSMGAVSDTCAADSHYQILARPDSVGSTLGYPIGVAGAYYQDRFFISSECWKWRIYYSEVRDPDNIAPENFINLDMDRHDEIVWMGVFNGILLVFGKYSIYGINASRVATPITKSLGCDAPHTIALGDDYIYFKSANGVYRFKPNIYGSMSYDPEKISILVDDIIGNIDPQNIEYCGGIYLNNQYWFSYHPDSILVFDERTQQWYGPQTFGFTSAVNYASVFGKTWDEILLPNAVADTNEWTVSTGSDSHYYYVYRPDSLDKYLYTSTSGEREFFEFSNVQRFPDGAVVKNLTVYTIAKKGNATYGGYSATIYIDLVANGIRYSLDFFPLGGTWNIHEIEKTTNPINGSTWVKGDFDSLKIGIKVLEGWDPTGRSYLGAVWAKIEYEGDLTQNSFLFSSPEEAYIFKYGGITTDDTTDSGVSVYGKHITATMQTGFFDNDLPVDDKLLRQLYLQTESDSGDFWVYYYVDYGTTPSDSDLVHLGGKRTSWWTLGEKVKGKNFSIEVENKSNVDSLTIKGWSAILKNLGHRGGE